MQEGYYQSVLTTWFELFWGKGSPGDGAVGKCLYPCGGVLSGLAPGRHSTAGRRTLHLQVFTDFPSSGESRRRRSGGASSPWAGSRNILRASCSATSRLSPSPRLTAWTCCAPPALTLARSSCCTAGRAKSMPCCDSAAPPDIEVTDEYGVVHRVWKVSDPAVITAVREQMRDRKLIIADGHHRYETALDLSQRAEGWRRNRNRASHALRLGDDDTSSTWMRPGLVILPTHRLVFGLPTVFGRAISGGCTEILQRGRSRYRNRRGRATAILQKAGHAGTALLAVATGARIPAAHPESDWHSACSGGFLCGSKRSTWCNCTSVCWKAS